jgi:hypothetical protein
MEGSVLSFLKVEWKVSDTGSGHWAFIEVNVTSERNNLQQVNGFSRVLRYPPPMKLTATL